MPFIAAQSTVFMHMVPLGHGVGDGGGDGDGGLGGGGSWQQHVEPVGAPGWQFMLMHRPFCWAHS